MTTRRRFIKMGAATGIGALALTSETLLTRFQAAAATQTPQMPLLGANIPQFVDPLPTFVGNRVNSTSITVQMLEFQQKLLPASVYSSLSAPFNAGTFQWGYKVGNKPVSSPGFTIEAQQGTPTTITYINSLPAQANSELASLLTIDQTIHWADPFKKMGTVTPYKGVIPSVVHLHGAEVPSEFDGGPEQWFTRDGMHGKAYSTLSSTHSNAAIYKYPNTQPATALWFHDHSLGMTRINVFSGLTAFYLLRSQFDTGLPNNPLGLPAGSQEIELVIQDRQFDTNGQLLFPDGTPTDNPTGLNGPPTNPSVHPFWIPEFFGDAIMVNGKTWPFLDVEPRRYRFRFLNASNARFYRMHLENTKTPATGLPFWQIGSDGGLFDLPSKLNDPNSSSPLPLFLAPSERADIILDFSGCEGRTFTLVNDAVFPYPSGNAPDPNVDGRVMQFRVKKPLSSKDTTYNPASGAPLRGGAHQEPAIIRLANPKTGMLSAGVTASVKRQLALVEVEGPGGPIEVTVNNTKWTGVHEGTTTPVAGSQVDKGGQGIFLTELPRVGSTEMWEIINLTQDAHPIHIHLIQFQLISRQNVDVDNYRALYDSQFPGGTYSGLTPAGTWGPVQYAPGTYIPGYGSPLSYPTVNADKAIGGNPAITPFLQGDLILPDATELGWKDTLKMFPGQVTRIAIRWAPITTEIHAVKPGDNLYSFDPTVGPGYVWHCHILDHEDNEMMRPYAPVK